MESLKQQLHVDESFQITGVAPIEDGKLGHVSFLNSVEYEKYVSKTKSSCLITSVFYEDTSAAQILVKDPYAAFAVTAQQFYKPVHSRSGINDKAFISETANVSEKATLYPNVYVDEGAVIEEGAVLYPGVL